MQDSLVRSMRSQLPQIRARWEALLHVEPVTTPLANPDTLVHLIDWTTKELFQTLGTPAGHRRFSRRSAHADYRHACPCGRNPLLAYFAAGEQAMREALVLAQAGFPMLDAVNRQAALDELDYVLRHIAIREIAVFCGVCQYRAEADGHAVAPGLGGAPPAGTVLLEKAGRES